MVQMWTYPYLRGHQSIEILAIVGDREGLASASRLHSKQHKYNVGLLGSRLSAANGCGDMYLWLISSWCLLHDLANGFMWGLRSTAWHSEDIMTSCWAVVENARTSFEHMALHLYCWLNISLRYVDLSLPEEEDLRRLYVALDLPANLLDDVVDLQLRCHCGVLYVRQSWSRASAYAFEKISKVLCSLWTFKNFSESRWLTLGPSARRVVLLHLVGGNDLLRYVIKQTKVGGYFFGNYVKIDEKKQSPLKTFAVAAFASYVCDAGQQFVMTDDRVLRQGRAQELLDVMSKELHRLHRLPDCLMAIC